MDKYLIITGGLLTSYLTKLIAQKESRGFDVDVLRVETLNRDPARIREYVLSNQPRYLLLAGDHDTVPPYPLNDGTNNYGSDAFFSMTDTAVVPAVRTGRLSTSDPSTLTKVVNAILTYPTEQTIWWKRQALLTGWLPRGPEDLNTPGGQDDAGWKCVKEIASYYDVIMRFENNRSDPSITEARKKQWRVAESSKSALKTSIESGVAVVRYLGHGDNNTWHNIGVMDQTTDERFTVSDVQNLNIANGLPLVLSVACITGQITASPSFAEAWQIYGKAIGVFAPDTIAATEWADRFTQCFFHCLVTRQQRKVGDALLEAMRLLNALYPQLDRHTYKKFRYLGDPDTILAAPEDDGILDCRRFILQFANKKGDCKLVAQEEVLFPRRVRRVYPMLNGVTFEFTNEDHHIAKISANLLSRAVDIKIDGTKVSMSVELSFSDKNKDDTYNGAIDAMVFALMDPRDR